jgi:hypothetical protein
MGSSSGLGYLLLSATSQLNTPLAFAALFALSFLGLGVYAVVELVEIAIAPWAATASGWSLTWRGRPIKSRRSCRARRRPGRLADREPGQRRALRLALPLQPAASLCAWLLEHGNAHEELFHPRKPKCS